MPVSSADKIDAILDTVAQMSVAEAKEFKEKFKDRFGIDFPAAVQIPEQVVDAVVEEQSSFEIVLSDAGSKKLETLKTIREIFGYSLQDAKAAVDSLPHQFAKGPYDKTKAEQIKEKFVAAGATIQLK